VRPGWWRCMIYRNGSRQGEPTTSLWPLRLLLAETTCAPPPVPHPKHHTLTRTRIPPATGTTVQSQAPTTNAVAPLGGGGGDGRRRRRRWRRR
jgi:hypothetical protein